jgi:hypothetical protein
MFTEWSKPVYGDWATGPWNNGIPQAGDIAVLAGTTAQAQYTVSSDAAVNIADLFVGTYVTLDIGGNANGDPFVVTDGGANYGWIMVESSSNYLIANLQINAGFVNYGTLSLVSSLYGFAEATIGLSTSKTSTGEVDADGVHSSLTLSEPAGTTAFAQDTGNIGAMAGGTVSIQCSINGAVKGVATGSISAGNANSTVYLWTGAVITGENFRNGDGGYIVVGNFAGTPQTVIFDGSANGAGAANVIDVGAKVEVFQSCVLEVTGPLTNEGVIGLGPSATPKFLDPPATLTQLGEVQVGNAFGSATIAYGNLTNNGLIDGTGTLGSSTSSLTNVGTIDSNVTKHAALIINGGLTNQGLIEATNDGSLIVGSVANTGTIAVEGGGYLNASGPVTSGGVAKVDGFGTLEFDNSADVHVRFGERATLQLDDPAKFSGDIAGFGPTGNGLSTMNTIDLRDVSFAHLTTLGFKENAAGTAGALTISDGTHTANLSLLGNFVASFAKGTPSSSFQGFVVSDDGSGAHGTAINYIAHPTA